MIYADTGRLKLGIMFTRSKYDKDKPTKTRTTVCTIVELLADGKAKELIAGSTRCGKSDNFNKEEGRKKALSRAICQHVYNPTTKRCKKCHGKFTSFLMLRLNKAERLLVWQAYFTKAQAPKAPKKEDLLPNVVNATPPENVHGLGYAGAD